MLNLPTLLRHLSTLPEQFELNIIDNVAACFDADQIEKNRIGTPMTTGEAKRPAVNRFKYIPGSGSRVSVRFAYVVIDRHVSRNY